MSPATRFRVVIADDEKPARERLRRMLERDSRVEIVACCPGGVETLRTIREAEQASRPVHILLLDVQMPEMNGFDVVAALTSDPATASGRPLILFVTAYDEYALRAFENHAVDYLLKPFSDERFEAAMDRAIRFARAGDAEALMSQMLATLTMSARRGMAGPIHRPCARLVHSTASYSRARSAFASFPLTRLSGLKPKASTSISIHATAASISTANFSAHSTNVSTPHTFVRVHRSAIVNIDAIHELSHDRHGSLIAILRDAATEGRPPLPRAIADPAGPESVTPFRRL